MSETDTPRKSRWLYKPDAEIHAEVVTSEDVLDEIYAFSEANPIPRWRLHSALPPYPSRAEFSWYLERGNDIYVARDQDGVMWGWSVRSRREGRIIWIYARREPGFAHETLPDGAEGLTLNARNTIAHMHALAWARHGEYELIKHYDNSLIAQIDEVDEATENPHGIVALTKAIHESGQYWKT